MCVAVSPLQASVLMQNLQVDLVDVDAIPRSDLQQKLEIDQKQTKLDLEKCTAKELQKN
jgi:hypothetical protein